MQKSRHAPQAMYLLNIVWLDCLGLCFFLFFSKKAAQIKINVKGRILLVLNIALGYETYKRNDCIQHLQELQHTSTFLYYILTEVERRPRNSRSVRTCHPRQKHIQFDDKPHTV